MTVTRHRHRHRHRHTETPETQDIGDTKEVNRLTADRDRDAETRDIGDTKEVNRTKVFIETGEVQAGCHHISTTINRPPRL